MNASNGRQSCAYILGCGPSLLKLTAEEIQYLNDHPRTLSLNEFLMNWRAIGIVPKCHLLADAMFPAIRFFVETQREIERIGAPIRFFVHHSYLRYFPTEWSWRAWKHAARKRFEVWWRHSYRVPLSISREHMVPISQVMEPKHRHLLDDNNWYWADSLDQPLYFYRGTLSTAINLASVIWPDTNIKLLGVDLNTCGYFYDSDWGNYNRDELNSRDEKWVPGVGARHHAKARELQTHSTAVAYELEDGKVVPGIQTVIPRIADELAKSGVSLTCCNPTSKLVLDGVCPFAPVIE